MVKLLDLDPQSQWFDPWCSHDKICTAVGPFSKALNPTLLQGYVSCLVWSVVGGGSYHQGVATGLERVEADAEEHYGREGVVVDEASAMCVAVASVEGQICVGVAREQHWAKVDLQGDGLHPAVNADVSLRWNTQTPRSYSNIINQSPTRKHNSTLWTSYWCVWLSPCCVPVDEAGNWFK